jgi:hypothetical protein
MKTMKNFAQSLLRLFYNKLSYRGMYAIHSGDKVGSFFIYIEEENRGNSYALLLMPNPMEAVYVSRKEIEFDLKYNNIKYVRKIPRDVYDVCKANFMYYAKKAGIYAGR